MRIRFYWHPLAVSKLAWNLISDKGFKLRSNRYTTSSLNSQLASLGKGVLQAVLAPSCIKTAIRHEKT